MMRRYGLARRRPDRAALRSVDGVWRRAERAHDRELTEGFSPIERRRLPRLASVRGRAPLSCGSRRSRRTRRLRRAVAEARGDLLYDLDASRR
ncbi:MAG: hypothetical protein M5U28_05560 [Sandaracinaceae bacterium]|nr:hypothetical protein [Sandaracinaceae bacterium]